MQSLEIRFPVFFRSRPHNLEISAYRWEYRQLFRIFRSDYDSLKIDSISAANSSVSVVGG